MSDSDKSLKALQAAVLHSASSYKYTINYDSGLLYGYIFLQHPAFLLNGEILFIFSVANRNIT